MTVDERDNDPVVLCSHVVAALRRECPGMGAVAGPESVGAARIDLVLEGLINQLVDQGDVALILDGVHRLSDGAARNSVSWLNGRLELDLAPEDVDRLVEGIEGWAAGLYLAALFLRGTEHRHDARAAVR
jgi:ATP/maltotriose-dependent transcriptional regulator MalT